MLNSRFRIPVIIIALGLTLSASLHVSAQETEKRGRKYTPPPATAHVAVAVLKDTNGKPVENAAVVFHLVGEEGKGNMELKTNEEGKAIIDVIPIGNTVRLQVIASGFQTFGEDFKIDGDTKDILVRLKRPSKQYSTYEHAGSQTGTAPSDPRPTTNPKSSDTPPAPQQ